MQNTTWKLAALSSALMLAGCGSDQQDTLIPEINLLGDSVIEIEHGSAYQELGAEAIDDRDGTVAVVVSHDINTNVVGDYTVTYVATDAAGNSAQITRTVSVVDTQAPEIVLIGEAAITINVNTNYSELGASATDNADGELTPEISHEINTNALGDYTITYTATDNSGNSASITRTLTVVDGTAPVLTLNGEAELTLAGFTAYQELGATVTDDVDTELTVELTGEVDSETLGEYVITYTATDASGNVAQLARTVTVVDMAQPSVMLNGEAEIALGYGAAYSEQGVAITDDFDASPMLVIEGEVDTTRYGEYQLTYTATDAAGNQNSVSRLVSVAKPNHKIKADFYDTCVYTEDDGQLRCWGLNNGTHGNGTESSVGYRTGEAERYEVCLDAPEQTLTYTVEEGAMFCDQDTAKVANFFDGETQVDRYEYCEDLEGAEGYLTRFEAEPFAQCQYGGYGFYHGFDGNEDGVLQITDMGENLIPTMLPDALTVVDFDIANEHGCAIFDDKTLRCWGDNDDGVLGRGDEEDVLEEAALGNALVNVELGTDRYAVEVHTSEENVACALLDNGEVKCWGNSGMPLLGQESEVDIGKEAYTLGDGLIPINFGINPATSAPYKVLTMDMGQYAACAVLEDYQVKCWGENVSGVLGLGQPAIDLASNAYYLIGDQNEDMGDNLGYALLGDINAVDISLRHEHACVLTDTNQVKCWGDNNDGELGIGDVADRGDGLGDYDRELMRIDSDEAYTITTLNAENQGVEFCPVSPDHGGLLLSWGVDTNENEQLDDDEIDNQSAYCDDDYMRYALDEVSENATRTNLYFSRLGADFSEMGNNLPFVEFGDSEQISKLSTSRDNSCALFANGKVKCWGEGNTAGYDHDLDYGAAEPLPVADLDYIDLGTDARVVDMDSGYTQTCVVFETAQVKCWGYGEDGELGMPYFVDTYIGNGEDFYEMGEKLPFVEIR